MYLWLDPASSVVGTKTSPLIVPFHASCSPHLSLDAENVVESTLDGTSIVARWDSIDGTPVSTGRMHPWC